MLVFVVEPDRVRASAIRRFLATRGAAVAFAHDFASAEALLTGSTRPGVVYVADRVPPLSGADLLPVLERNARMSGVPLIAAVADDGSLLAAALRRGGVHVVTDAVGADQLGALLASLASTGDDIDWRATVLA